jgi:hypothetical protein
MNRTAQPRAETQKFIEELQLYANRKLNFPEEIGQLIDQANEQDLEQVLLDAMFHAKFATKTHEVMNRIGRYGEGFDRLSVEFQNSVEKVSALLKTLVKESPEEVKLHLVTDFFAFDQMSFNNFLRLLEDLSWMKNWEVDGRVLPLKSGLSHPSHRNPENDSENSTNLATKAEELGRISNVSRLGSLLSALFLILDPPSSILGWGIGVTVLMLFVYIVIASYTITRKR